MLGSTALLFGIDDGTRDASCTQNQPFHNNHIVNMAPPVVCKSSFADEEVPRDKQSYRLVRLADDESSVADSSLYSNDPDEPLSRWQHLLHQNLVPDACFQVKGIRILDGVEAVRFLKFVILTFVGILFVHWLVRVMVRLYRVF
jgi:hypothetical protein